MSPEDYKYITVNVDSQTAKAIADEYVHYKYFEATCMVLLIPVILVTIFALLMKLRRKKPSQQEPTK